MNLKNMKKKILSVMLVLGFVWIGSLNLMANIELLHAMNLAEEVKKENSEYKEILLELQDSLSKAENAFNMWERDGVNEKSVIESIILLEDIQRKLVFRNNRMKIIDDQLNEFLLNKLKEQPSLIVTIFKDLKEVSSVIYNSYKEMEETITNQLDVMRLAFNILKIKGYENKGDSKKSDKFDIL